MGFLKKIRNNILNQDNSFHVGFGNRSPFSYTNQYSGDWTPEVPDIETPKTDLGEGHVLQAKIKNVGKIANEVMGVVGKVIQADAKNKKEQERKKERSKKYQKAFREIGSISSKNTKEFVYEPTIPINEMMPTTSTSGTNTYPNLYPNTQTKSTQDYKNDFNQKKCNFDGGTWDSTTNTCS